MKAAMDHIVLNVVDVERALAFYVEVVGLQPERVEAYRALSTLQREGYDRSLVGDPLYVRDEAARAYVPLTAENLPL